MAICLRDHITRYFPLDQASLARLDELTAAAVAVAPAGTEPPPPVEGELHAIAYGIG